MEQNGVLKPRPGKLFSGKNINDIFYKSQFIFGSRLQNEFNRKKVPVFNCFLFNWP